MSASKQTAKIVTRTDEAEVLRMFIGGAAQHAIVQHFGFSKGTVSKLINGIYPFVQAAGDAHAELPKLRDAATKRHLSQCLQKSMRLMSQLQATLERTA